MVRSAVHGSVKIVVHGSEMKTAVHGSVLRTAAHGLMVKFNALGSVMKTACGLFMKLLLMD